VIVTEVDCKTVSKTKRSQNNTIKESRKTDEWKRTGEIQFRSVNQAFCSGLLVQRAPSV
jgi:hypothetical protein